jgi:hypothetical protein
MIVKMRKKNKKKSYLKREEENEGKNLPEKEDKLSEYLKLREKEKKTKGEFNFEDLLKNENPNLQQIRIGQRIPIVGRSGASEIVKVF